MGHGTNTPIVNIGGIDYPIVQAVSDLINSISRERDSLKEIAHECLIALDHAKLFISTKERMHKSGRELHQELIDKIKDELGENYV